MGKAALQGEVGQEEAGARGGAQILRPIIQFSLAALAALGMVLVFFVGQFDTLARQLQQDVVMRGYRNRFAEVADVMRPRLAWNAAVAHLTPGVDPRWIDGNLAGNLYHLHHVSRLFVLSGDDHLVYAARDGVRGGFGDYAPYRQAIAEMAASLRHADAARRVAGPLQVTNLVRDGGQLMILVATRLEGESGAPADRRAMPIVVGAVPFDGAMLARFDGHLLVHDLAIGGYGQMPAGHGGQMPAGHGGPMPAGHGGPMPAGHDGVVLLDQHGAAVGLLHWVPRMPGIGLIRKLQVPLGLIFVIFGVLAWGIMRQARLFADDLIASEAHARHLAHHDALTQLPNRTLMLERLAQLMAAGRRAEWQLAVHCLDLDRFKEVNDTMGHPAGDELIRAVAARLVGLCRESDTVARLGGDEFVILQPYTTANGASHLAERIVAAFAEPFVLSAGPVEIGVSIGVTLLDNEMMAPSEALRQADMALYGSKEGGRGRTTFFETEMDVTLRMRRSLEVDLRRAMLADELTLAYQPQVDVAGKVCAMEALVRWKHPSRGIVPPSLFIPLAEECGMIVELGEYILRRVLRETAHWGEMHVAINVSALQLRAPSFMAIVTRAVAEYRVDPNRYEFEITETVLLGDDDATRDTITVLKQEGFTIALDDFGTGFSSLSSLQRFAVDKIKIDRSFVRNLDGDDQDARTLVEAIIKLGAALGLGVIAEGVETVSQHQCLIESGCPYFQGYLLGMPEPAPVIEARYLGRKAKRVAAG